eukprot:jgi/Chrpa1/21204/Chrysochromulina_OHIO_Genome00006541-RA
MTFGTSDTTARVLNDDLSQVEILQECARLPRNAQWSDQRFPADIPTTLYVTGEPADKPFNNGQPVRWLRPHEIAGAVDGQLDLIKDGLAAGDVAQGELGDCYLLGAMSSIASRNLLGPLIKPGVDPRECINKGFITFLLYKFGEWVEVSVDTLIPCNEESQPIFAHGKDPSELWVPLLEKAYAKLHGSYEALDGGSVSAALVDLTGGVGESIDMTDEDVRFEIGDGSFWKRLKRYNSKGAGHEHDDGGGTYLLGAALSRTDVEDKGGLGAMQVTDLGILVNHAYSLIDVQEVGDGEGKLRLVQLRNPWGMKEWEGPWSDSSREWETAIGMRAREKLNVQFEDDGTFWMAWEDFQAHFNKIYVCRIFQECNPAKLLRGQRRVERPPPGSWCRYEIEGEWTEQTAGGCFNFPEWRKNPQYEIRTGPNETQAPDPRTNPAALTGRVLSASDGGRKRGGDEGGPVYEKKIGMYIMRGDEVYRRRVLFDSDEIEGDEVVDSTPFMAYRDVTCNTMDEENEPGLFSMQRFVLIPSTFAPGGKGIFRIVILTSEPLEQPPEPIPPLKTLHVAGAWTEANAGGCRNFYTWRKNEQYHLQLSRPARVSVVLARHNPEVSEAALHSKKKAVQSKKKKKPKDANFLMGFIVAVLPTEQSERKLLRLDGRKLADGGDIIDKTTFSPTFEVAAEFVRNPIYMMRASRTATCELFLRQESRERLPEGGGFTEGQEGVHYEGIGFYVTVDDGSLSLEDVYCDQPSLRIEQLSKAAADARRAEQVENEAARTIVRWFIVSRIWKLLRARPPDKSRARKLIVTFFLRPVRDNDEGYLDINLALNALESAYIQLTGNPEAKESFFPEMRKRLKARGHKIADY